MPFVIKAGYCGLLPLLFAVGACSASGGRAAGSNAVEASSEAEEETKRPYPRVTKIPEVFHGCWELDDSFFDDELAQRSGATKANTRSRLTITAKQLRQDASWMDTVWVADLDYGEMYAENRIQLFFKYGGMIQGAGDIVALILGPDDLYDIKAGMLDAGGDAAETAGPYRRCAEAGDS